MITFNKERMKRKNMRISTSYALFKFNFKVMLIFQMNFEVMLKFKMNLKVMLLFQVKF